MGNRAVIQFGRGEDALGIYLHWNGGPESVDAFLDYAQEKGVRTDDYGVARLAQIIGNFMGGTLSVGVGLARNLDRDNYDNGTYIIGEGTWTIVERVYHRTEGEPYSREYHDSVLAAVREVNDPIFGGEGE